MLNFVLNEASCARIEEIENAFHVLGFEIVKQGYEFSLDSGIGVACRINVTAKTKSGSLINESFDVTDFGSW